MLLLGAGVRREMCLSPSKRLMQEGGDNGEWEEEQVQEEGERVEGTGGERERGGDEKKREEFNDVRV